MNCPIETQDAEVLLDYCAGRLSAERMVLVERHLTACGACREFCDSQAMVWEALDSWEPMPVSADFDRRLYARIADEQSGSWWSRVKTVVAPFFARPLIPVTAAACLVLAGGLMLRSPEGVSPTPDADPAPSVEVEQVERTLEDLEMLRTLDLAAGRLEEPSRTL